MIQEIWHFHIFNWTIPIYGFGLMLVIGFLLSAHWAKYLAYRSGLDGEAFVNAAMLALLAGIVGARLSHILENLPDFTRPDLSASQNLLNLVNITSGGLTYYGGFLLATPTLILYARHKKIPVRLGMDIVAPCIVLALGFGRVGCFLNGCCYGAQSNLPWAVRFPYNSPPYLDQFAARQIQPDPLLIPFTNGRRQLIEPQQLEKNPTLLRLSKAQRSLPLHPAQLYSTFTSFLIAAVVFACFTLRKPPGRAFALMLILEGSTRFLLELLRAEPAVLGPMSLSMILGLLLAAFGLALWPLFGHLHVQHPARD